jgi:hypothetical protein
MDLLAPGRIASSRQPSTTNARADSEHTLRSREGKRLVKAPDSRKTQGLQRLESAPVAGQLQSSSQDAPAQRGKCFRTF